ncbi:MAG: hypothetical protein SFU99_16430, partial [Saprospiraceae bacterium]|nr:hypothetical protein [Saprospiraceae bacterium]
MKKCLWSISFLFLPFLAAFCQPQRLYFHHINAEREGELSQTGNFFVFKDSRGFLWVSSTNGLNR